MKKLYDLMRLLKDADKIRESILCLVEQQRALEARVEMLSRESGRLVKELKERK